MIAKIKSIHLENFKGVKDKSFNFNGVPSVVTGRNASGKTTIADGYYWLFFDKDTKLVSNPDVKPLGVEECIPTVTVVMDIDGKEVEFSKIQKIKASKPDENGIVKRSITNTYAINSVPKSEKDFKAYLDDLGFPAAEQFLVMSHTDVFSNMKNADMRKALFEMVTEHSDKEIADKLGNVPDLAALLDSYKLEEVDAMNKATIKRCKEQLENIPGQIEGLEMAKTENVDTSEQEILINSLKEQISIETTKEAEIRAKQQKLLTLKKLGFDLQFERTTELTKMNEQAMAGRNDIESKLRDSHNALIDAKQAVAQAEIKLDQSKKKFEDANEKFEGLKKDYENTKALTFDDSSTICPVCHRPYESDRIEEIKASFENDKKQKMNDINHKAKEVQFNIENLGKLLATDREILKEAKKELKQAEDLTNSLQKELDEFKPSEVTTTPELAEIDKKIEANEQAKAELDMDFDSALAAINSEVANLQAQINEANKVIGANSNNVRIDEQIVALNDKRIELEQARADAEKILFQCELLAREKNNLVAEEINSNFRIVSFQLWEMQKNGTLKDACIPQYEGKALGVATNTALETMMKIDICAGFQKFYGKQMPIFVDQAEVFSSDTYNNLECSSQHIYLKVSDDDLEVK